MTNVILHISTSKRSSEVDIDLGYSKEEWEKMNEISQEEVINESVWDNINVWVEG